MIRFDHPDGSKTVAKDAAHALTQWYLSLNPPKLPPNPRNFTLYVGSPIKYPTSGAPFIALCIAAAERLVNSYPTNLDEQSYDEQCRRFLIWLERRHLIDHVTHDGELDPPAKGPPQ